MMTLAAETQKARDLALEIESIMDLVSKQDGINSEAWLGLFLALPRVKVLDEGLINDEDVALEFFLGPAELLYRQNEADLILANTVLMLVYPDKIIWRDLRKKAKTKAQDETLSFSEILKRMLQELQPFMELKVPELTKNQLAALELLRAE